MDGGLTFVLVQNNISLTTGGGFSPVQLNLSGFGEIEDQPYVIFRFFDFGNNGNNFFRFDNLEFTGDVIAPPVASPPVITFDDANTTDFLRLTETGRGFVNGSIGDGTDPAKVDGIAFALANTQPGVTFSVTSSNQAVVTDANINVTTTAKREAVEDHADR